MGTILVLWHLVKRVVRKLVRLKKCNLRYSGNNSFQRCNGEVKRCKVEYNKGDCDTKSVISITTEKTTAIKCQFEGVNDDVRNSEFFIQDQKRLSNFFFQPTRVFKRRLLFTPTREQLRRHGLQMQSSDSFSSLSWLQLWPRGIVYSCYTLHFDHKCVGSINSLFNLTLRQLSSKDVTILEIITYVGLCLSIIGILSTITLYFFPHVSAISSQSVVYFL